MLSGVGATSGAMIGSELNSKLAHSSMLTNSPISVPMTALDPLYSPERTACGVYFLRSLPRASAAQMADSTMSAVTVNQVE